MLIRPLPPLRPHATSATSPLAGLDTTGGGNCHHQWSPLLGTLLFGVPCTGWCWQRGCSVTSMVAFAPGCPVPPPRLVPLSHTGSWDVTVGASAMLSCRASLGWCKLCVTPQPARGASVPGLRVGVEGALSPWQGLHQSMMGVLPQVFSASTCPWPVLGEGCGGLWVGSRGPRVLFTATELVSFHLPRGKQLAIC